jgi:RNA polymerase sigma-70 factor, ECF subfamily
MDRMMDRHARVRALVDEHIGFVERTLRKAGVPPSELDDEIQRTFITVSRRIEDVRRGAERSFLFQVAINMAAHSRRDIARRREVLPGEMPPERIEANLTPESLTQRKQLRGLLDAIVGRLDEPLRKVFILHEFEGMDLPEIAGRLGVPRGTAASRLRRARAHLRQHVAAIDLAYEIGATGAGAARGGEPAPLRREQGSALGRALLDIGISPAASAAASAKTLATRGLAAAHR